MSNTYGIAELLGFDVNTVGEQQLVEVLSKPSTSQACPFRSDPSAGRIVMCSKAGGVCSIRRYQSDDSGAVSLDQQIVTTCPHRFLESSVVHAWVGEVLLGTNTPRVVREVPFLIGDATSPGRTRAVGKIDCVLVNDAGDRLEWCALEMQAVYFSGARMESDLGALRGHAGRRPLYPKGRRHPDFRSSGPKRLMPQLETKVPTISRWGRKTAVVVDSAFWDSLGHIGLEDHLSNSEIAWFVVCYEPRAEGGLRVCRGDVHYSTLQSAVSGLTGGRPVSLAEFEALLRRRLGPG